MRVLYSFNVMSQARYRGAVELTLVSWNLFGLEAARLDERTEALVMTTLLGDDVLNPSALPDVVMFQEVVKRTFFAHIAPHLKAAGYRFVPTAPPELEYFELLAVRPDWEVEAATYVPFPNSRMHRGLTQLMASREGHTVTFMTSHLESLRDGHPERETQAALVAAVLDEHAPAVFAGDTNLRTDEAKVLEAHDAFIKFGKPRGLGTTWRAPSRGDKRSRGFRFDRVFVDGKADWEVRAWVNHDLPELSDHVGLRVTLAF